MARARTARVEKSEDAVQPGAATPPERLNRRERNKQEKLLRIKEAARELFHSHGFERTTTVEIAERANIGSGTLFLYAKSKEDLLVLVFADEILEALVEADKGAPAKADLVDQCMYVFDQLIAYHRQDVDLSRHILREVGFVRNPDRRDDVGRATYRVVERLVAFISAAQSQGKLREDVDPEAVGYQFFWLYYGPLLMHFNDSYTLPQTRKVIRASLETQINGLRPAANSSAEAASASKAASAAKSIRS